MESSRQFDGIKQQMFNVGEYDADGSWCQPKPALGYGEAFPRANETPNRRFSAADMSERNVQSGGSRALEIDFKKCFLRRSNIRPVVETKRII
ncbi:MAG: hypothetical protein ABI192_18550 [Bradyrhizobium sp.]